MPTPAQIQKANQQEIKRLIDQVRDLKKVIYDQEKENEQQEIQILDLKRQLGYAETKARDLVEDLRKAGGL